MMPRAPIPSWASIFMILVVMLVTFQLTDSFRVDLLVVVATGLVLGPVAAVVARIAERRRARRPS